MSVSLVASSPPSIGEQKDGGVVISFYPAVQNIFKPLAGVRDVDVFLRTILAFRVSLAVKKEKCMAVKLNKDTACDSVIYMLRVDIPSSCGYYYISHMGRCVSQSLN